MATLPLEPRLIEEAGRCVSCGLCLPHCPTYTLARHEADSPRGRISLIKALAQAKLEPDESCVTHLEGCLLCRRCESVCPANVPFGYLMDKTRQALFDAGQTMRALPAWLAKLVLSRFLQYGLFFLLWVYHHSGLRAALRKIVFRRRQTRLARWEAMLPPRLPWPGRHTRRYDRRASVALFTGCIAKVLDSHTLLAVARLIRATGHELAIPAQQVCCGALHQHAGDDGRCDVLLHKNAAVLKPFDAVVSCTSGCGLQLSERQAQLATEHWDVHAFLLEHASKMRFRRLDKTVALHTPCTMRYLTRDVDTVTPLLKKVPGLRIKCLPAGCCGAAGAYMLTHRDAADAILHNMMETLENMNADVLLSSNVGCVLHFRQALARRKLPIETLHPAVLLERQLSV